MVNSLSTIIIPSSHRINDKHNNSHQHHDDSSMSHLIPPPPSSSSIKRKTSLISPKANQNNKQILEN